MEKRNILLLEPFYSGSHKQLMSLLYDELLHEQETLGIDNVDLITMTGKKWHWRARTSGLYMAQNVPMKKYDVIFTSCVLPFHDFISLRPELKDSKKIIYFHENQLVYPIKKSKGDRDFQYGYNQIMSCLVADLIMFNSEFNMSSFLSNLQKFFKLQPDFRPQSLREKIEPKCSVLYFPLNFEFFKTLNKNEAKLLSTKSDFYRIVWPHRWEFDKNPEMFFNTLYKILEAGITNFRLSILGENFKDNPECFTTAKDKLGSYIDHFGFLPSKEDYYSVLTKSDIVISTSIHEFFGVAMIEAIYLGSIPLCPNTLVYPEIIKNQEFLFKDENDLFVKLSRILRSSKEENRGLYEQLKSSARFERFDWKFLKANYMSLFIR